MNINVESIYFSKLNNVKSRIESKASQSPCSCSAFQTLLSSIEQKMNISTGGQYDYAADMSGALPVDTNISREIENAVAAASANTGLDANLIKAVIQTESSFNTDSVSGCGATGLMQLMPATAREVGVTNRLDVNQNVNGGSTYLKKQIDRFGDVRLALAAYNCGPARVASMNITDANDANQYNRISPGVRGYVDRVLNYYGTFQRLQG